MRGEGSHLELGTDSLFAQTPHPLCTHLLGTAGGMTLTSGSSPALTTKGETPGSWQTHVRLRQAQDRAWGGGSSDTQGLRLSPHQGRKKCHRPGQMGQAAAANRAVRALLRDRDRRGEEGSAQTLATIPTRD